MPLLSQLLLDASAGPPLLFVLLDQLLLVTLQGSPGLYSLAPGPMALVPLGLLLLPPLLPLKLLPPLLLLGRLQILQLPGPPPLDSTR